MLSLPGITRHQTAPPPPPPVEDRPRAYRLRMLGRVTWRLLTLTARVELDLHLTERGDDYDLEPLATLPAAPSSRAVTAPRARLALGSGR